MTTDSSLSDALTALVADQGSGLPVLDPASHALVGWITHQTVLTALHPATATTRA
ncbi:hypothetical protein [Amycolatopsis sp. NBC_01480]|uniref:hypothetical protein n=1 Tax=Amycolatopsis sp. NBC_01480 TaxID=2903562 RepID=UPI002E2BF188|nr:hypothetical protein [Amycolatopsis sp. NBC_01480]